MTIEITGRTIATPLPLSVRLDFEKVAGVSIASLNDDNPTGDQLMLYATYIHCALKTSNPDLPEFNDWISESGVTDIDILECVAKIFLENEETAKNNPFLGKMRERLPT